MATLDDPQVSWADVSPDTDVLMPQDIADVPDAPSYASVARRPHPRSSSVSSVSSTSSVQSMSSAADPDMVHFTNKQTAFEADHLHPLNTLPDRPCSAFVRLDKNIPIADVFKDLHNCRIPISSVRCFQRNSNGSAFITFSSEEHRNPFLQKSYFIPHADSRLDDDADSVFVAVYDAPFELPDSAIRHRLGFYGTVLSSRRCKLKGYPDIHNGIRVFKCQLNESVPSFLRFLLRVKHPNQVPTCRKCNRAGHVVKDCPNQICFNCEELSHVSRDCTDDIYCTICRAAGHFAVDCRFLWKRRPARNTADQDVPAAAPTDEPPSSPHPPPADTPSSDDVIPPSQSSQPPQPLQPSQPSQPSPPPQPTDIPSTTDSDVLLAAAASAASDALVAAALSQPDVVVLPSSPADRVPSSPSVAAPPPVSSAVQSVGTSSATTSSSSGSSTSTSSSSSFSSSSLAASDVPASQVLSSDVISFTQVSADVPLFSPSQDVIPPTQDSADVPVFSPPLDDQDDDMGAPSSALSISRLFKAATGSRRKKSGVPVFTNRRPAKITNVPGPPVRKSTVPALVSSRK